MHNMVNLYRSALRLEKIQENKIKNWIASGNSKVHEKQ